MLIDTHCHLSDPAFADDLPAVIERAKAAGVERIVSIATTLEDAHKTLELTHRYDGVFAAVGLHPGEIPNVSLCDMMELAGLASEPKVVAIGETGLDYYRLPNAASGDAAYNIRQLQKDLFWAQLELAKERRLPVVIHNRSAEADILEIVRAHADGLPKEWRPWGVMHCFGGEEKFAFDCIEIGLLISYTGILTFKNAVALRDVAKKVSLDHVMLETDAPYLAPQPHRSKRNEPAFVPLIAGVLAEIKGLPVEEVARVTTENAQRLFRLPGRTVKS
jgi:TatD DNase family protein